MSDNRKIMFEAIIEQNKGMDAAYISFPYSVEELFGVKGQVKVKAMIDGKVLYRGSLANMGFECHILGKNLPMNNSTFHDHVISIPGTKILV
ncbi:MAG: DUF1905 domain-containing protein [Bacteroidales bacterium]